MPNPEIFRRESLLTVNQVRRRLNCSRSHVYNLMDKGESAGGLPSFRVGAERGRRVPEDAVEKFLNHRRVDPGE
jgi:excisionase family DNA binding protein